MTRLARDRDTHLEPEEIATVTLALFDRGQDPSVRQLAAELKVTPSAIYHHFDSRAQVVQAAVDMVWQETLVEIVSEVEDPFTADPVEVLVAAGVVTRRALARHHRIVPYMAATPQSGETTTTMLGVLANVLERLGLTGEEAANAFHYYASFTFGTAVFAANRRIANEQLAREGGVRATLASDLDESVAKLSTTETRESIDRIIDLSESDPERDERLFAEGLRILVESIRRDR